jgi:hypothetical protein
MDHKNNTHVDEMKNFIFLAENISSQSQIRENEPDELFDDIFEDTQVETPSTNESILIKKLQDLVFKYQNHYQALDESRMYYGDGYNDALSKVALDLKMLLTKVGVI